jgi:replicative DNA helicase
MNPEEQWDQASPAKRSRNGAHGVTRPTMADRLPPHDEEAERGVLSCILRDPSGCLDDLDEMGMQPEWFYDLKHQVIFKTMRAMHFRQPPVMIDVITLFTELRQIGMLEDVGGVAYISPLPDVAPGASYLPSYAATLHEKWQLRQALTAAGEISARVYEVEDGQAPGTTAEQLVEETLHELEKVAELRTRRSEVFIRDLLRDKVIPKLEAHYTRGRAQMNGLVTTGLEYLDKIFCGLGGDNGNYHVFAARPNVGKTSLVTGMALHAALDFEFTEEISEEEAGNCRQDAGSTLGTFRTEEGKWYRKKKGVPVGISSLEMSAESLGLKILFQRAQADLQLWRTGFAKAEHFPPLTIAAHNIGMANNILIDDTPRENIQSIKAKWRRWHRQHGVRFFLLDYIQLIKSSSKRFRQDRVQEMEEISAELQALGKELNCPMAILAQLNRDYEKEPNRLPRLSDLKNCGAIEQDADSVTLLYKPSPYKPFSKEFTEDYEFFRQCMESKFGENWKKWSGRPERINALVEKNKHGPKGDAQLLFLKSSTLFVDWDAWLKQNNFKGASKGEESRYKQEGQEQMYERSAPDTTGLEKRGDGTEERD